MYLLVLLVMLLLTLLVTGILTIVYEDDWYRVVLTLFVITWFLLSHCVWVAVKAGISVDVVIK